MRKNMDKPAVETEGPTFKVIPLHTKNSQPVAHVRGWISAQRRRQAVGVRGKMAS